MKVIDVDSNITTYAAGDAGDLYHGGGTIHGESKVYSPKNISHITNYADALRIPWVIDKAMGRNMAIENALHSITIVCSGADGCRIVLAEGIKDSSEIARDIRALVDAPMIPRFPTSPGDEMWFTHLVTPMDAAPAESCGFFPPDALEVLEMRKEIDRRKKAWLEAWIKGSA